MYPRYQIPTECIIGNEFSLNPRAISSAFVFLVVKKLLNSVQHYL